MTIFKANPDATNSELDAKVIIRQPKLNESQIYDLVCQYVQIRVDRMSHQDLEEHVKENLTDYYCDWSINELETIIEEELLEELVDNVTNETITQGGQS